MYIRIAAGGEPSLQDTDNMRAFSVFEEVAGESAIGLAEIGIPDDDDHYWLDADAVVQLSGRKDDLLWVGRFRDMLAAAAAYGYYDEATDRVKAHVEHDD